MHWALWPFSILLVAEAIWGSLLLRQMRAAAFGADVSVGSNPRRILRGYEDRFGRDALVRRFHFAIGAFAVTMAGFAITAIILTTMGITPF